MKKVMNNPSGKSLMLSFTIDWNEGPLNLSGSTFHTWNDAQVAVNALFDELPRAGKTLEVHFTVCWNNGKSIAIKIVLGTHKCHYCPWREDIGEHLKWFCDFCPEFMDRDTSDISFEDMKPYFSRFNVTYTPIEYSHLHVFKDGSILQAKY